MKLLSALFFCACSLMVIGTLSGQNSLSFSQGIIVGASTQTVPTGKIWKVESIFGEQANFCVEVGCAYQGYSGKAYVTGMYVNGILIPSTVRGLGTVMYDAGCAGGSYSPYNVSCGNKTADPNILPMWLPAGTTLASGGNTTFVNVLEFNIE